MVAFLVTSALEFLQLWRPGWLQSIRATLLGRLALGTSFAWSDFPPYAAGAALAWIVIPYIGSRNRAKIRKGKQRKKGALTPTTRASAGR
jgi:hypothetical protein